jgi:hypothetical protein
MMSRGIILGGEHLEEGKSHEGLDWKLVLNPLFSERTLEGS